MKTTPAIPNDLYRELKTVAALERIRVKGLVAEGLHTWTLVERTKRKGRPSPLEVRDRPLHSPDEIARIIGESRRDRREGWNRNGLPWAAVCI